MTRFGRRYGRPARRCHCRGVDPSCVQTETALHASTRQVVAQLYGATDGSARTIEPAEKPVSFALDENTAVTVNDAPADPIVLILPGAPHAVTQA